MPWGIRLLSRLCRNPRERAGLCRKNVSNPPSNDPERWRWPADAHAVPQRIPHVWSFSSVLFDRPRDRSRHRQHPDLCPQQGHRAGRALGRRHPPRRRPARQEGDPGGRPRSQGHARQGARQHRGDPPDEGRRHRRLRDHRADDQAVHQDGASALAAHAEPAHHHLRALRLDPGRAPRHQGRGRSGRRHLGLPDRGTDGRRDRRRPAGVGGQRLDGGRHRRRHHRSGRHLARRHGLQGQRPRRRRPLRRGHHQLHPPQLRHADRRADGRGHQEEHRLAPSRAPRSRRWKSRAAT